MKCFATVRSLILQCMLTLSHVITASAQDPAKNCPASPNVTACFTPGDDCEGRIVGVIDKAKQEVLLQTYLFTSTKILGAVKRASDRGVRVRLVLDDALESRGTKVYKALMAEGFDVRFDSQVKTAHSKVVIVDRSTLVTGSFNFTKAAQEKNAENILILSRAPSVLAAYVENWLNRYKVSRPPT